ncbi:MAG: FlxA-like family protein [bacterium]|nr:FlxA-like family protein [bacterium]
MVVVFPPPITNFLNIIENLIYFYNEIENINEINEVFINSKINFINFLEEIINQTIDDWELIKQTIPINTTFINSMQKNINELNNIFEKIKTETEKIIIDDIDNSIIEKIVKNTVLIIRVNNTVGEILKNQKFVSTYPIIDKFLKIFWMYIQNIKNLENFPIDLMIRYLFGSARLIENLEKQIKNEKETLQKIKIENEGEVKKILEQQESLIEAQKYALGAAYQLITGEINLIEDPELPNKIFIQINQASNTFFILERNKNQKINIIEIIKNYEILSEEQKQSILTFLKNTIFRIILNPLFINNNIEKINEIEYLLGILKTTTEEFYEYIEKIEFIGNLIKDFENLEDKNIDSEPKPIREILNALFLFLNYNLPLTTFINLLVNIKNTLRTFILLNLSNVLKIDETMQNIENLIKHSMKYIIHPENFENVYLNFLSFYSIFRELYKEVECLINQKLICPSCKTENDFFSQKCINCNLPFPLSIEKLVINSLQNSPLLIQNYVLELINNLFIKREKENTLYHLENTIKELSNLEKNLKPENQEKEIIRQLIITIEKIKNDIENDTEETEILEEILKFLEYIQFLRQFFELPEV